MNVVLEDGFGTHEFSSDSDCVCICDDGNGNVSIIEDYEEESLRCDDCDSFCLRRGYCKYEGE